MTTTNRPETAATTNWSAVTTEDLIATLANHRTVDEWFIGAAREYERRCTASRYTDWTVLRIPEAA